MKILLAIPATLFCLALHASASVPPAEKLLPDDTLVMFSSPDFTRVRDILANSPQARLWNDPSMKAFREKFMEKLKSTYITPLERELGVRFDDYTSLPQGQVTFAMTQDGWEGKDEGGKKPGLLFLLDAREKSPQLKSNLANLRKKWVDAGKSFKSEKIRDVEFSVVTITDKDLPKVLRPVVTPENALAQAEEEKAEAKKEPSQPIYIGQAESLLIMGNSAKAIEKVLAAMSGGSVRTIGDLPSFAASRDAMFRDAPIYGWANASTFVGFLGKIAASGPFMPEPGKIVSALGLNGLKTAAFSYRFADDGATFDIALGVPEENRTGIFKLLAGEAKDTTPPPFVPADAVEYQRWRIDGQKAWATIRRIIDDASPLGLSSIDMTLDAAQAAAREKNPDFDIRKSIFGNLGDDIITYEKNPRGESIEKLASPPSLTLIASPNASEFANAVKTLLVLTPLRAQPTERDFNGRKIYSIELPSVISLSDSPESASLHYASSGGYLAITSDVQMLEEYLRSGEGQGKSLREVPGLSEATQKVAGSGTMLFGYSNESENMRVLFNLLKKDASTAEATLGSIAMLLDDETELKDWVDVSLLPTYDKIAKYFHFSVYSGSATRDGLNLKAFSPTPPQLRK